MTLAAMLIFSAVYLTLVRVGTFRTLKSSLLIFLSVSLAAGPTMADVQTGLYLGIGGGASRLMPGVENAQSYSRDSVGTAWNTSAGYQLSPSLGLELEYSNLGTTTLAPLGSIDYQDINVSGLYHLGGAANKLDGRKFSVFGRLGVGRMLNQSDIQLQKGNGTHWLAGAGIQIPISRQLSLRGEGIYYAEDVSRAGLALTYRLGGPAMPAIGPMVQGLRDKFKGDTQTAAVETDDVIAIQDSTDQDNQSEVTQLNVASSTMQQDDAPLVLVTTQQTDTLTAKLEQAKQAQTLRQNAIAKPLALSAAMPEPDEVQTQEVLTNDVEPITVAESEPKKTWLFSGETYDRMQARDDEPEISAALPQPMAEEMNPSINEPISFDFDSSELTQAAQSQLQPLVDYLKETPDASLTLTGHTDNIGLEAYNRLLSLRRAEAVRKFLLQQGLDKRLIRILGAGEKRPVQSNASAIGRKANRRVAIVLD